MSFVARWLAAFLVWWDEFIKPPPTPPDGYGPR